MQVITVDVEAQFVAGGGMVERYEGSKSFGLNVFADADPEEVEEKARERAIDLIAKGGCWHRSLVRITEISITGL